MTPKPPSSQLTVSTSKRRFEKQLTKFLEESEDYTFLSVRGLTVSSEFSVDLAIIVADTLGETKHEQSFPFTIRSRQYGKYINDLDSLGVQPVSAYKEVLDQQGWGQIMKEEPFALPGCNF